ncbi:hypothetical protein AN478_11130 [Thiohalorhabdus denitrificans]|uniref:Uncharacterized protein n=1 Tax=Thiohalorhabdus denitrificans TaxID=381306 RepID=A0A0P9GI52_9GAMM|nr:hypothetical protein [Thiohalorhabdus denitrificans]KPV39665.1 hypothetical protein AN478_11130 [Thiohalorhabdus denitrificans]SCX94837.1 hypothetical protein SAMN05661077_0807 [Thiohalorhabdus denitrificans]
MSSRSPRPGPCVGPALPSSLDSASPLQLAADHLRRVLRLQEGTGPTAEERINHQVQDLLQRLPTDAPPAPEDLADQLWAALLEAGRPAAARFFRPYRAGRGPVLWVRRADTGADPLARERVEAVLERRCRSLEEPLLDGPRIHRLCRAQLRDGMREASLVRVLALTSPGQAAVLDRLCGGA